MIGSILRGADALIDDARAKVSEAKQLVRAIENRDILTNEEAKSLSTESYKNFQSLYEDIKQLKIVLNDIDDRK